MRMLFTALLVLAVSVFLTLAVLQDNGYILVGYGDWTVEGSLAFFLLVNLALFALLYLAMRTLARIWGMPKQLHDWRDRRGVRRAQRALTQGLVALSEGNWKRAERDLIKFADRSETPLLNYLAAARSAQQQGAHERRDHYLQLAHESMPSADVAVGLTQAELQLDHEQLEQALATLMHLQQIAPKHTHVLKLLKELYERLDDWRELHRLLPVLKRRKVIDEKDTRAIEITIYRGKLAEAAKGEDAKPLQTAWKQLPRAARSLDEMVTIYANHLMNKGEIGLVEQLLRSALEHSWNEDLVELYGRLECGNPAEQLSAAEGWLKSHPQDPVLLLTLGRLCLQSKLWGKARSYLEASIGAGPQAPAYRALGALLEAMGERELATECFKSGLELSSNTPLPKLPPTLSSPGQAEMETGEKPLPPDVVPPKLEMVADAK